MPAGRPTGLLVHAAAVEAMCSLTRYRKKDLAAAAGVSPGFIADLLAHRSGASRPVADRIAATLRVPTESIFPELAGWVGPLPDRTARRTRSEVAA